MNEVGTVIIEWREIKSEAHAYQLIRKAMKHSRKVSQRLEDNHPPAIPWLELFKPGNFYYIYPADQCYRSYIRIFVKRK